MARKLYALETLQGGGLWSVANVTAYNVVFRSAVYFDAQGYFYDKRKRRMDVRKRMAVHGLEPDSAMLRIGLRQSPAYGKGSRPWNREGGANWTTRPFSVRPGCIDWTLADWCRAYAKFQKMDNAREARIASLSQRLRAVIPEGTTLVLSSGLGVDHTYDGLAFIHGTFPEPDPLVLLAESEAVSLAHSLQRSWASRLPARATLFFRSVIAQVARAKHPSTHLAHLPGIGFYLRGSGFVPESEFNQEIIQ